MISADVRSAAVAAYAAGASSTEVGKRYGVSNVAVLRWAKQAGIATRRQGPLPDVRNVSRQLKMVAMFRQGLTLQKIGDHFGITRERVRQLISRHGVSYSEGGAAKRVEVKRDAAAAKRDAKSLQKYGVPWDKYRAIVRAGGTHAYRQQKRQAILRGIAWNISLRDWWHIWQESGKWSERGRGADKFVMSRILDSGGYEIGNVHIQTLRENSRDAVAVWKGKVKRLPRGVFLMYPAAARPYLSKVGKKSIGYFATPEEAAAARLQQIADAEGITRQRVHQIVHAQGVSK